MDKQEGFVRKTEGETIYPKRQILVLLSAISICVLLLILPIELAWIDQGYRWYWYIGIMAVSVVFVGIISRRFFNHYAQELETYRKQITRAEKVALLGLWQYYMDRDKLVWSDQVKRMFGLPVEEQISFKRFMKMVHPEERALVMFRDLSRIQELEASLDAEQRLSQTIISHLPGIFTVVNKDLELLRWNDNLAEILGYDPASIEEMTVVDFIHASDQQIGKQAIEKVWADGHAAVELRLRKQDGNLVPYYFIGVRFESEGEELMLTLGFSMEEKEHLQAKVQKSQMMFAQLFQNAPLAIAWVDSSGTIQLVNDAFELIFGYHEKEVIDKNIDELLVPEWMLETSKELTIGTLEGDSFQIESVRLNKTGEEVPVLVVGIPVQDNGSVESIFGMYVDISKRKRLEDEVKGLLEREKQARKQAELERNRIWEMFEQAPSAIALVEGREHRYVYVNEQYRKMTDDRVLIGEPLGQLMPELRRQGFVDLLDEVYQTGETRKGTEVAVNFKQAGSDNLESRYFNYLYKPLKNASGEVENIFIEVVDVTEEFRAKEQIKKSLEEKVVLLQEVHHRVKNNLALVSSLLQLQADESDQPELEKNLREARNRIYSISKIHEILYQDENLADVSFGDYVRELVEALEKSLKPVNTAVDFELELQTLSLSINQAIPAGLLINELVSNAYEHAFRGRSEGEVQIEMKKVDGQILLNIQDDGVGLPKDFELSTGNTLGWTLIQTLVKQLHGQIDVDSSAQGTGIQIRFPHQLNDDAMLN
ncbi:MAG: PAS domain S-box protein [Bacteroidota bacterium]